MPRAVGVDIGSRSVKVVELSGSAKALRVQHFAVHPFPQGEGEEVEEARVALLREVFAKARLSRDDVCASFDAGTTVFREITVPFRDPDKIEQVVRFEAENHLHGRAIEDVVVNWAKVAETKDGSQLIVFAAPKKDLTANLERLRRAGVEPSSMDLDATALYTACDAAGVFRESPAALVLEIGARTTNLLLVDGGQLRAVRSFVLGSESMSAAVEGDLALPPGEGHERAFRPGGADAGALLVRAADVAKGSKPGERSAAAHEQEAVDARREELVRKLVREVMRSMSSVRTDTPPTRVLLAGGGSTIPGLAEALAERLGLPVEPLGLLSRLGGLRPSGPDAAFEEAACAVAAGCAMRLLGIDPIGVELRQDELAPSNKFDVVGPAIAVAVTILVAIFGFLAWSAKTARDARIQEFLQRGTGIYNRTYSILVDVERQYQKEVENRDEKKADEEARKVAERIGAGPDALYHARQHLTQRFRKLESDLGLSNDVPPIESALKVEMELYKALNARPREEYGYLALRFCSLTQSRLELEIETGEAEKVDKVVAALSASPYFRARAKEPTSPVHRGPFGVNTATNRWVGRLDIEFATDGR